MAADVGRWIGEHGGQLVYGGGNNGLMGMVADATLAAGGRVVGVIPHALVEREWAKRDCTELHVVDNMHERKRMMAERADAFLALPGGIGTFEEFFEVWTWRQLGYHDKPVGLLDPAATTTPLLAFLRQSVRARLHERLADGPDARRQRRRGPAAASWCRRVPQPAAHGLVRRSDGTQRRAPALRPPIRRPRRCGCAPRAPRW